MLRAAAPRLVNAVCAEAAASATIAGAPASSELNSAPDARQLPVYTNSLLKQSDGLQRPPVYQHSDSDWDMCSDEEAMFPMHLSGRSLGPVPTKEEVQQASQQLRDTLKRNMLRQKDSEAACADQLFEATVDNQLSEQHRVMEEPASTVISSAGARIVHYMPNAARDEFVGQAMDMFNRDRDVQEAVVSLAQDPAIWQAIQQNEGVRSLLHRRRVSMFTESQLEHNDPDCVPDPALLAGLQCTKKPRNADPLGELLHRMVLELNNVKKTITAFARGLFGIPTESEPDLHSTLGQAEEEEAVFPAVLILTILVVGIVVFNRPVIVG